MLINYSIIIPHHNLPHLLKRCLSSIPQREDLQIIVVDDKSDEQYREELHRVETVFPYVSFCYQDECHGAGKARNVGLEKAKGKYVLFADSDDFFNYCINDILDEYREEDSDIVYFNANSSDTDTYIPTKRNKHLTGMIREFQKHKQKGLFKLRYIFGEPWCKMVKREIIEKNNIRFEETIIHNDTAYSYLVGYYCQTAKVDKRCLYCVTDRIGSVSKQQSLQRLLVRTEVFARANIFFKEHHIPYFEEKALRPMMQFLLKGKFKEYKKCKEAFLQNGFSQNKLHCHQLCYPLYIFKKFLFNWHYKTY